MEELPAATRRVVEAARERGLDIDISEFPEGTKTAADAAKAIGCSVAAIVKSLVFTISTGDDRERVVALVPGDRRLDPAKLAAAADADGAERATLQEVRDATGYAAGGTPPFGHATRLRIFADPSLRRHDPLWAAAGTPTTVFPIGLDDLERLVAPHWVDVTES